MAERVDSLQFVAPVAEVRTEEPRDPGVNLCPF